MQGKRKDAPRERQSKLLSVERAARAFVFAFAFAPACTPSPRPAPAPSPAPAWTFHVTAAPLARTLSVDARFPAGSGDRLIVDDGAGDFVDALDVDGVAPSLLEDGVWSAPACADGCRVRYTFRLSDAADALHDVDVAARHGAAVVTSPSGFLLRPPRAPDGVKYRLRVDVPDGVSFVTGLPRDADGTYLADANVLRESPFSAFGALDVRALGVGGAVLDLAVPRGAFDEEAMVRWARSSASVVGDYYRSFPIAHALLLVVPVQGDEIGFGQATGGGGATILARVGQTTSAASFDDDWVLPHEMVHLGMPYVARHQHWWVEGVATYVEPIARARAHRLSRERVWQGLVDGLPKGLPRQGDRGLDRTPTWGRTYWGGALFCLLADLEIRKRTKNARSLDDALRAVVAAGGDIHVGWSLDRIFEVGDRATGTDVLRTLYARMGFEPVDVDLAALWRELGVVSGPQGIAFDEGAPSAAIRRAIDGAATASEGAP